MVALTEAEVDQMWRSVWVVRRFGLQESSGIRPIDDCTEVGHTAASPTSEFVDLGVGETVEAERRHRVSWTIARWVHEK